MLSLIVYNPIICSGQTAYRRAKQPTKQHLSKNCRSAVGLVLFVWLESLSTVVRHNNMKLKAVVCVVLLLCFRLQLFKRGQLSSSAVDFVLFLQLHSLPTVPPTIECAVFSTRLCSGLFLYFRLQLLIVPFRYHLLYSTILPPAC